VTAVASRVWAALRIRLRTHRDPVIAVTLRATSRVEPAAEPGIGGTGWFKCIAHPSDAHSPRVKPGVIWSDHVAESHGGWRSKYDTSESPMLVCRIPHGGLRARVLTQLPVSSDALLLLITQGQLHLA